MAVKPRMKCMRLNHPADLEGDGGGDADALFLMDSTPCQPKEKGPLFVLNLRYPFWLKDPKFFPKAPLALIFTDFEGKCAPKKTQLFGQNFPKNT